MIKRIALFLVLFAASPAWADKVLYCQDELATGIIYKDGSWKRSFFSPERYTVKVKGNFERLEISGQNYNYFECSKTVAENVKSCVARSKTNSSILGGFSFLINTKSLRFNFARMSSHGYVAGADRVGADTSIVTAGTCTEF